MAISFRKYVDIVSGVGGGVGVAQRELIGRIFSINPLLPPKTIVEFTDIESVGEYFGITSEEYQRALPYFGWVSKDIRRANKISFCRWVDEDSAPAIFGNKGVQSLGAWTSITAGAFYLTIGGIEQNINALNFSAAASLSDVAAIIQAAIRLNEEPQFEAVNVTWDAVRQSFNLVGTYNGDEEISVAAGSGTDVAGQLGWLVGAIFSDGTSEETVVEALTETADVSNNFGSFLFMPELTIDQWEDIGEWNTTQNILYMGMVPVTAANASAWYDAIGEFSGLALTLVADPNVEFDEMIPMIILAATDYSRRAATKNYMFNQFAGISAKVTTTNQSNTYDLLRVNYMGVTQTAGQYLAFYQRGVLTGIGTAPTDQNVYTNEMWLKDAAGAAFMELFLNLNKVSANAQGRSEMLTTIQSVVDRALFNGTISVGKPLNNTQKLFIAQITGDDLAWHQVQGIGYWYDVVMQSYVTQDDRTEWKAVYTLIYSKDDVIRKVEGSHILI
jgi:hypothetical protein